MEKNISIYTRPRYIESPFSANEYAGVLKTPTLSRTNNILAWSNIDSQTNFYELYVSVNDEDYTLYDNNIFFPSATYSLPFNLEPGTYKFKIRAVAILEDSDLEETIEFYSAYSEEIEPFTVIKLDTPELEAVSGTSQYYFDEIEDATRYTLSIVKNNIITDVFEYDYGEAPTAADPLILDYTEPGVWTIYVNAFSNDQFLIHNSDISNIETYTINKLAAPNILDEEFISDPPTIFWQTVSNANAYDVYLNDEIVSQNYTSLSYNFNNDIQRLITEDIFDYSGKVKAKKTGQTQYANPKYLDSDFSIETNFGVLPTPEIEISDNVISISNYSSMGNAQYFKIYDGPSLLITIPSSNSEYTLQSEVERIFNIRVQACSDDIRMVDSNLSNLINYQIVRLRSPVIEETLDSTEEFMKIQWAQINNADFYDIYINNKLKQTVRSTSAQFYRRFLWQKNLFYI